MGLLSFIQEAGEKLFGRGEAKAAQDEAAATPSPENIEKANRWGSKVIDAHVRSLGLDAKGLEVSFDQASKTACLSGECENQEMREKIIVAAGNVDGVAAVDDRMTVAAPEPESRFYTVVRGDNLSKIAKEMYGSANKYPVIFEANKPMLSHPDKIYPGQVLRIPPL